MPTLEEVGAPDDLLVPTYFSLFAPPRLPGVMIDSLVARGLIVRPSTGAAVQEAVLRDRTKFAKLIRDANIRLN